MEINDKIVFKQCDYVNTGTIIAKTENGYLVQIPSQQVVFVDEDHVIDEG